MDWECNWPKHVGLNTPGFVIGQVYEHQGDVDSSLGSGWGLLQPQSLESIHCCLLVFFIKEMERPNFPAILLPNAFDLSFEKAEPTVVREWCLLKGEGQSCEP